MVALGDAALAAHDEVWRLRNLRPTLEGEIRETPHHRVEIEKDIALLDEQIVAASQAEADAYATYYAALEDPSYWTEGPEPPEWFDPAALHEVLADRPPRCRAVFAATCAERLVPAYRRYCDMTGRGAPLDLESLLGVAWNHLTGRPLTRTDLATCIDACNALMPARDHEWSRYAADAVSACEHALRTLFSEDEQGAVGAATCAYATVLRYVMERLGVPEADAAREPLVQAEVSRQGRDLDELFGDEIDDTVVLALRDLAKAEGPALFG